MNITKNGGISRNLKIFKGKRRKGLSELVGTLAMVSITLVAGAAVFGWINGQANSSETAYGVSVANNINFLRERFVVVTQSFSTNGGSCSGSCNQLSFWAYNDGQITFSLLTVRIQNLTDIPSGAVNKNPLNILFYAGSASACSPPPSPQTCGFVAYNKAGTLQVCWDTAAWSSIGDQPGFYQSNALPVTLAQGL